MATIKSYTDISQSKKLANILPFESADAYYTTFYGKVDKDFPIPKEVYDMIKHPINTDKIVLAWSLTALLNVLEHPRCFKGGRPTYWFCGCSGKDKLYHEVEADNPVDACVNMIIKLNELNLL